MRIAIVGSGDSWREAPWEDASVEIWSMNDTYTLGLPRTSRWLECHPWDRLLCTDAALSPEEIPHGWYKRPAQHKDWLASCGVPVYLQQARPEVPTSRAYPIERLAQRFRRFLTGTPAFAAALAIDEGATWIGVYGCNLTASMEYREQRDCLSWLLGIAEGMGITVEIAPSSSLLKAARLYAFEPPPVPEEAAQWHQLMQGQAEQRERALQIALSRWWANWLPPLRVVKALDAGARGCKERAIAAANLYRFGVPN